MNQLLKRYGGVYIMDKYSSLNEMQQRAVYQTEGPVLILAGAGSGKTRVLTHRISYLVEELMVPAYHILAITFTNKAAKEMKERAVSLVGSQVSEAWISTFHSACIRILKRHADRLGYDKGFTVYDPEDQKAVIRRIMKELNLNRSNMTYLNVLKETFKLLMIEDMDRDFFRFGLCLKKKLKYPIYRMMLGYVIYILF